MDPEQYEIVDAAPTVAEYLELRSASGLSAKAEAQAIGAVANSWYFCHVRHSTGETVAMGRVIGDGGWYFHIADMATHPEHQRRGLGRAVLQRLLAEIAGAAPENPHVTLIGDPPGRRLYESMGFRDVQPSLGMVLMASQEPRSP